MPYGIDIASYQDGLDVGQAVREGYEFVFVKATEGTSYRNPYFVQQIRAAHGAGALPGAYHFLRAGDGAAQARAFLARVNEAGLGTTGVMLACDNEADASWDTTEAFFHTVWDITGGHHVIMYSGKWWWKSRGWNGTGLSGALWDSKYVAGTGYGSVLFQKITKDMWTPGYGGWDKPTILQFSSKGQVAGQVVDVNYVEDMAVLRALAMIEAPAPDPGPAPTTDGDWNLDMSFDDFKNGTIGTTPPDWMGGPRDKMRMADWYGSVPGYLTTIEETTSAARQEAAGARATADATQQAVADLRAAVGELKTAVAALSIGGVDVAALAASVAALLPPAPSAAQVAVAVADEEAGRMRD